MYHVRILEEASRELARLDKPVGSRVVARINRLAENLNELRLELLGGDLIGFYKLRIGDYRVIYEIIHNENTIVIHTVGHRREIYLKR